MKKLHLIFCLLIVACLSSVTTVFGAENSGTEGENIINITVPTTVQFVKSADGNIIVPDNTAILNSSEVGIKIDSVQINTCNDWVVEPYGTDLSSEPKDSKRFAIQLNSNTVNETGAISVSDANWGNIGAGESLALDYNVDIPRTKGIDEQIATIVFTVSSESTTPTQPDEPDPTPSYVKKDLVDGDAEMALWEYSIDSETNTATVLNYLGETNADLDLVIPTSFNGAKTTAIKSSTSNWNNYTLKSLTIPKGVSLGGGSSNSNFYKLTAEKVIVEDECTISTYAFNGNIGTMKIGKDIVYKYDTGNGYTPFNGTIDTFETDSDIGKRMLEDVTIKHLVLGTNCKSIGSMGVCRYSRSIESIQGIENVEYLGDYALDNCFAATAVIDSMTIKATVESRALSDFTCNSLTFDSAVFKGVPVSGTCNIGTLTVQNSDMSAVSSTFNSSVAVNTLVIGKDNNYGTQSSMFQGLGNLTTVILNGDAPKNFVRGKATVTTVEINEGCESVGDYAFANCKSITSITGFEHLRNIGAEAFANTLPADITVDMLDLNNCTIGRRAFFTQNGVTNISTLKLTNCTVNDEAFVGWDSTRYYKFGNVEITNSVLTKYVFTYDRIDTLTIKNSTYTSLYNSSTGAIINNLVTDCDIPTKAFSNVVVTSVTILEGCESIGDTAFYNCKSITSITGLEHLRRIGASAFCNAFPVDVVIDNITLNDCALSNRAFLVQNGVINITTLTLNNCTVNDEAFAGWGSTQYYNFGTVEIIDSTLTKDIFTNDKIDTLTIKNSTYTSFSSVVINALITDCDIPTSAFSNAGITSATILDGCKSIGATAFANCSGLAEVELPADCTYDSNSFNKATVVTVRGASDTLEALTLDAKSVLDEGMEDKESKDSTDELEEPTEGNADEPTEEPVDEPEQTEQTDEPTKEPTEGNVDEPTEEPMEEPEQTEPTDEPTEEPEQTEPTEEPTEESEQTEHTEETEQEITEPTDESKSDDSNTSEDTATSQDEPKNTEIDIVDEVEKSNESVENTDTSMGNETTSNEECSASKDVAASTASTTDKSSTDDSSAKSDNVSNTTESSKTTESSVKVSESKSDVSTSSSTTSSAKSDSKEKVIKKESKEDTSAKVDE